MIRFRQLSSKPLIRAADRNPGRWWGMSVLNPSAIVIGSDLYVYFRAPVGTNDAVHGVGLGVAPAASFSGSYLSIYDDPILLPSDMGIAGDARLQEPCVIYFNGEYRMWVGVRQSGIVLTRTLSSTDAITWTDEGYVKDGSGNALGTPNLSVVDVDGTLWGVHSGGSSATGGFKRSIRTSADGLIWSASTVILDPATQPSGDFDDYTYVTAGLVYEDPYVYLFVPGGGDHPDWPEAIGLWRAHKSAPTTWTPYGNNPVMLRGPAGTSAEGSIWSPAFATVNGRRWMFYEGAGSNATAGSTNSNGARDTAYYSYNVNIFSNICAAVDVDASTFTSRWNDAIFTDGGTHRIGSCFNFRYLTADGAGVSTGAGTTWTTTRDSEFWRLDGATTLGVLTVTAGGRSIGDPLTMASSSVAALNPTQNWHVVAMPGRAFLLQDRYSGLVLGIPTSADASDVTTPVELQQYTGAARQRWYVA